MTKEILLTPEELYYLGTLLQAKNIDYAYVAAMDDIGGNYELFEKETAAKLVKKGVLLEDFSGNMQVEEGALKLLQPIFFGGVETALDVCVLGEKNKVDVSKYHFYEGRISAVVGKESQLFICETDDAEIEEKVESILPKDYSCMTAVKTETLQKEDVTRIVSVKSVDIGQKSVVKVYIEANGVMYQELEDGTIESMTREMFTTLTNDLLKGV